MVLSRRRRWLYSAFAAIVVPTVFFLVLEGGLRTFGYGYPTEFLVRNGDFYDSNPRFGWRFFPRTISRPPMPLHLPVKKPPDRYRVFVLGGSAARGEPDAAYGFARMLQAMLEKAFEGARFEIVNTAMTAINSHVVREIARDCANKAKPDLFIVLMGNNEVIGPFGPTHTFGRFSSSRSLIHLGLWMRSTRSGQLVHDVVNALQGTREPTQWRGMKAFLAQSVSRDEPRMPIVYDHFEQNLRDISAIATDAGAKLVLSTVPVNLKDSAPFASMHRPDLNEAQLTEWDAYYQRGIDSQKAGEYDDAVRHYLSATGIDGGYADLHFRLGSCYLALNDVDDARRHYLLARELDALRFRADAGINEAIRQVAAEWMDPHSAAKVGSPSSALRRRRGVLLVDAERAFAKTRHTVAGLPGDELFWEHVHMNFQGNYELAASVFDGMIELLPDSIRHLGSDKPVAMSFEECATRLALTDWDRERVLGRMQRIISVPPFTDQLNHDEARERVIDRRRELMKSMGPDALDETAEIYERAIAAAPDDAWLHRSLASFYMARTDYAAAAGHLRAVLKSLPNDSPAHIDLARTYLHRGMAPEAEQSLEQALASGQHAPIAYTSIIRACTELEHMSAAEAYGLRALSAYPDNALLLTMVAETYFKLGRHREASELLSDAIEKDPGFSTARWRLGTLLVMQGRQGGLEQLEKAVELEPFSPRLYSELAGVYVSMRKTRLAGQYMDKAEQLDPLDVGLARQHAEWLELAGDLPRAVRRYRRVMELSPASPPAALELAWLLAISADEGVRNPPEALRLAQDATLGYLEPKSLVVLAAAYAANGSFDEAVESVDRALAEARQLGDPGLVDYLTRHKKRYARKLPWSMTQEKQAMR